MYNVNFQCLPQPRMHVKLFLGPKITVKIHVALQSVSCVISVKVLNTCTYCKEMHKADPDKLFIKEQYDMGPHCLLQGLHFSVISVPKFSKIR